MTTLAPGSVLPQVVRLTIPSSQRLDHLESPDFVPAQSCLPKTANKCGSNIFEWQKLPHVKHVHRPTPVAITRTRTSATGQQPSTTTPRCLSVFPTRQMLAYSRGATISKPQHPPSCSWPSVFQQRTHANVDCLMLAMIPKMEPSCATSTLVALYRRRFRPLWAHMAATRSSSTTSRR